MPLYDLACKDCDRVTETVIPLADFMKALPLCECGGERFRKIAALHVVGDLPEYQAMGIDVATGKAPLITSRSQHREYLKRNNYVEMGNEKPVITAPRAEPTKEEVKEVGYAIKHQIDQKGIKL